MCIEENGHFWRPQFAHLLTSILHDHYRQNVLTKRKITRSDYKVSAIQWNFLKIIHCLSFVGEDFSWCNIGKTNNSMDEICIHFYLTQASKQTKVSKVWSLLKYCNVLIITYFTWFYIANNTVLVHPTERCGVW